MKNRIHYGLLYLGLLLVLIPISIYILASSQDKEKLDKKVLAANDLNVIHDNTQIKESKLKEITDEYFNSEEGDYSLVVKNLKTEEEYYYNSEKKYDSASLYKLWVMAVAYQEIKDGKLNLDDTLSAPLVNLNDTLSTVSPTPSPPDFSPTPITGEPEKISMTVEEALEKMITVSDNYAAILLSSKVGSKKIANFIKDLGFTNSNYKQPPQTSAKDISLFFEALYKGEIVDQEYSGQMIDLLKRQTLNDRIPKYLENVEIAHKTGELFGSKHDGGIIYSKNGDYILVVLSETKDYKKATEIIAKYSELIFSYFENS